MRLKSEGNYPAHTLWGAENIYVRRHIRVDDKELLKEHKVYVRYICDDQIKLFCNGRYLLKSGFTNQTKCQRLTDEAINQIVNGDTGQPVISHFSDKEDEIKSI